MVLDPVIATHFIEAYKKLLLEIDGGIDPDRHLYEQLIAARQKLSDAQDLLQPALARLHERGEPIADDVAEAVTGMQAGQWLYLRDTRAHSIFVDPQAELAYGVLGLTQRLKEVTGDSGVWIKTALLPFRGKVICDGLIANSVWLGANYRRSFNELLGQIRAAGHFRLDGLGAPGKQAPAKPKLPMSHAENKPARTAGIRIQANKRPKEDPEREERIVMDIVVDAYNEDECAIGWYCYLEERLSKPFDATCIARRATSPLKVGQTVKVLGMAPDDECMSDMLVLVAYDGDELAVPLTQLLPVTKKRSVLQAVTDWHYWVARGYEF